MEMASKALSLLGSKVQGSGFWVQRLKVKGSVRLVLFVSLVELVVLSEMAAKERESLEIFQMVTDCHM